MRYISNDDDFEEWLEMLKNLYREKPFLCVGYIIEQMELEIEAQQNKENK